MHRIFCLQHTFRLRAQLTRIGIVMDFPEYLVIHNDYLAVILALFMILITCYRRLPSKVHLFAPARRFLESTCEGCKIPTSRPRAPKPIHWYHEMYFQLQNLEEHPSVLESARNELLDMVAPIQIDSSIMWMRWQENLRATSGGIDRSRHGP